MSHVMHLLSQQALLADVEIERVFPWLKLLAIEQKSQFFTELFLTLGQAVRQHDWHIVENLVSRWQATSKVLAVPELVNALTEALEIGAGEDWDNIEASLFDQAT